MKKIIFAMLVLLAFLNCNVYALDRAVFDMRVKIFDESEKIKSLSAQSPDTVVLGSIWDTCIITVTQLDAYFYMLNIFNTIRKEDWSENSIDSLISWLNEIKRTNKLSIRSIDAYAQPVTPKTKTHMQVLKLYFNELNSLVDTELDKVSVFKKSLQIRQTR